MCKSNIIIMKYDEIKYKIIDANEECRETPKEHK